MPDGGFDVKRICLSFPLSVLLLVSCTLAADPHITVKGLEGRLVSDGTQFELLLSTAEGYIPDFEMTASGISRFVDSQGTDLGTKAVDKTPDYLNGPCFLSVESSIANREFKVTVSTPRKCVVGTQQLSLEGELRLKYAATKDTGEAKGVSLKNGTEVLLGQQKATIADVKNTPRGTEFALRLVEPPATFEIEGIDLIDTAGERVRASSTKQRVALQDQPVTYTVLFYGIKPPVDSITFKYELWPSMETLHVPFTITAPMAAGREAGSKPAPEAAPVPVAPVAPPPTPQAKAMATAPTTPPSAKLGSAVAWPAVKVSGIMGKNTKRTAMVNGEMVGVGEAIAGVTVVDISNDAVTLKFQGKTATLKAGGSLP